MKITIQLLKAVASSRAKNLQAIVDAININAPVYGITTPLRMAHFLAQASHESGGFRFMREIWGPTPTQRRYEGRKDLGNTQAGDGKRYMGRGIFQLTGRANYRTAGDALGIPLEDAPELAEQPDVAVQTAMHYWDSRNLNRFADADDVRRLTKAINGGFNGLEERQLNTMKMKAALLEPAYLMSPPGVKDELPGPTEAQMKNPEDAAEDDIDVDSDGDVDVEGKFIMAHRRVQLIAGTFAGSGGLFGLFAAVPPWVWIIFAIFGGAIALWFAVVYSEEIKSGVFRLKRKRK